MIFVILIMLVLIIVADWKIFAKAGVPGWYSLIPFFNLYTLSKIVWGKGWYFVLLFVPVLGVAIDAIMSYKLAKSFGKDIGYTVGLILLPPIFHMILGFGSAEYIGPGGEPAAADSTGQYAGDKQNDMMKKCAECGTMNSKDAAFCRKCGAGLADEAAAASAEEAEAVICGSCGTVNKKGAVYCKECGALMESAPLIAETLQIEQPKEQICPNCSTSNSPEALFCKNCGSNLGIPLEESIVMPKAEENVCLSCGTVNSPDAAFCSECGSALKMAVVSESTDAQEEDLKEAVQGSGD